ncbi:hypothetical protein HLH17_16445 [Acinetobacter sp. ANC 5380]|uniref:Uncharacterized protein n=1 Tax=Acinetobacter terrae TaxID=2731247 RepID=A0A7Y2RI76_9GAMM|nr:hypothetical protein [Acinetobacter terrae]NNH79208.1 hypothetical protein [Acinetobacter terrae]
MIIFRMIISGIIALSLVIYFFYVFVVSSPCERLSRATKPIDLGTSLVVTLSEPWSSPNTLSSIEAWSAKTRLKAAVLLRIQFYSKSEQPVICDWDKYVEVVSPTSSLPNDANQIPEYNGGEK